MSDATDLEAQAERHIRRGGFREALEIFVDLLSRDPSDERLRRRLAAVRAMIQDGELDRPRASATPVATPEALAEEAVARGEHARAIALYEQALAARPHATLLAERLAEIRSQAPEEPLFGATPAATRAAPVPAASSPAQAPVSTPSAGLPADRKGALEALLSRVARNRR